MQKQSRRRFFKSVGALGVASLAAPTMCSKSESKKMQNVLVIIGDDHATHAINCYGNSQIRTPNLDKLAANGVKFTNAFANAPMCSASRQSLLTGKYPHATGVTLLTTSFPDEENLTIPEHLKTFGYKTGIIGKNHFNNGGHHGFDYFIEKRDYYKHLESNPPRKPEAGIKTRPQWKPFRDPARIWLNAEGLPSEHYDAESNGTWYSNKAIEFIQKNKDENFCLFVAYHEPHSPFNFPIEYAGKYNPEDMLLPETSPEDDRWIPEEFKDLTEEERKGIIRSYYTSVEYLDKNVGMVLDELKNQGLDKNTLVIYIGDHGYLLNHHKRFEKHMMWEPAEKAPLIINMGDQLDKGTTSKALTEFVDLAPTIMDALGVNHLPDEQGKSLKPVLTSKSDQHKDFVFAEFLADNKAMVRTKKWKYIYTTGLTDLQQGYATGYGPSGVVHRLYNVINDPNEKTDVSKKHPDIVQKLQKTMLDKFIETHPKTAECPENISIEEKLAWFCVPPDKNARINAK